MTKSKNTRFAFAKIVAKNFEKSILWPILLFNFFITVYYAIRADLNFHTDIGRDFLLFEEIAQKKIVLIGARTSAVGVFHGPLWDYVNFPVFFLSRGNPVAQEWFWITLIVLFLFASFHIYKRLFDHKSAYFFVLLELTYLSYWAREFTHPEAAFLLMPFFFYSLVKYIDTGNVRFLIFNVLTGGFLIQLEIAAGAPIFVLSLFYVLYTIYKGRNFKHILAYLTFLIPASTYILFDVTHNLFQLKNLIKYIGPHPDEHYYGILNIVLNRLSYMVTTATPFISDLGRFGYINIFFSIIFFAILIKLIRSGDKNTKIYFLYLYFFLGYFFISLSSRYYLLVQDFLPFIPITFMIFASLVQTKYSKIVILMFLVIIPLNIFTALGYLKSTNNFIGKDKNSWKAYREFSLDTFKNAPSEFGYFIYSPDKLSYSAKYAMVYASLNNPNKKAFYFEKKEVTYVISEPPAYGDAWAKNFTDTWWIENSINIKGSPDQVINYPNGYRVAKYNLNQNEQAIPWDKQEDSGIHFR